MLYIEMRAQTLPAPRAESIEGTVVDSITRKPIAGVNIATRTSTDLVQTTTSASGQFVLAGTAGRFSLSLQKAGYVKQISDYSTKPGERITGGVILLSATGVITGRVLDVRGSPVPNVLVTAVRYHTGKDDGHKELVATKAARTDDRGTYRLEGLAPTEHFVSFSAMPGAPYSSSAPQGRVPPSLYPGVGTLSAAVPVLVMSGEESLLRDVSLRERFGAIRLHLTQPGEADVSCCILPRTIGSDGGVVNSLGSAPTRVRVEPGKEIVATYWPSQIGNHRLNVSLTGQDGKVERMSAHIDFRGSDVDVVLAAHTAEGRLSTRVLMEGTGAIPAPVRDVRVTLCSNARTLSSNTTTFTWLPRAQDANDQGVTQQTAADGRATFPNLPTGQYELCRLSGLPPGAYLASARKQDDNALTEGVVVTPGDEVLEILLRSGAAGITGTVRDSAGIVHDALVALLPLKHSVPLRKLAQTVQDGTFEFNGVTPGEYRIYAWSPDEYRSFSIPSIDHFDWDVVERGVGQSTAIRVDPNGQVAVTLRTNSVGGTPPR